GLLQEARAGRSRVVRRRVDSFCRAVGIAGRRRRPVGNVVLVARIDRKAKETGGWDKRFLDGWRTDRVREVAAERNVPDRRIARTECPRDVAAGDRVVDVASRGLDIEAIDPGHVVGWTDDVRIDLAKDFVRMELADDRRAWNELTERDNIVRRIAVAILIHCRIRIRTVEEIAGVVVYALRAMLDTERHAEIAPGQLEQR